MNFKSSLYFYIVFFLSTAVFADNLKNIALHRACYQSNASDYNNVAHLATDGYLSTFWRSKKEKVSWIYVDLGSVTSVSKIIVKWGTKKASLFSVELSSEGNPSSPVNWKKVTAKASSSNDENIISIAKTNCRFVKIQCEAIAENDYFEIAELEVYGKVLPLVLPPELKYEVKGDLSLNGRNWFIQHSTFIDKKGEEISKASFVPNGWISATVPGTVLSNYIANGAVPDPNYSNQQLMISESFFTSNFWYQTKFVVSEAKKNKRIWLNFNGINWKGDIYFNGHFLGKSQGVYKRTVFEVTSFVQFGKPNGIAVLIHKNDNPGEVTEQHLKDPDGNGGSIGLDSPAILASIGWNWMPTIRGRNIGIWNDVFLNFTDDVLIENPFVSTSLNLPDTTLANLKVECQLNNFKNQEVIGVLRGVIDGQKFEWPVTLLPNEKKLVKLSSDQISALRIKNPKLWWPNGYGEQPLYQCQLEFYTQGNLSDKKKIEFGIRHFSYTIDNNNLRISVNGKPIIVKGGNWGMAESMLQCDSIGYDTRVRLHKDMNMNMIRNWIGSVGHDEFYTACDKYGILVWDDFWLANPVDGPHPIDNDLFISTVEDKILRLRNHPSIALWCGRNEGYPPAVLDSAMTVATATLDPTRFYLSSSAHSPVTGLGPYETKDPKWYFTERGTTFHSEQGIVAPPNYESLVAMMPKDKVWPINDLWGLHDWTQPRVTIFYDDLIKSYGLPKDAKDFSKKAQMLNMEGPKAMFESWQSNRGPGVLVWMSHPAWPSLICQTYDYYFDATAAYYAFKKAGEPLHILWRADNEKVQIVNNTFKEVSQSLAVIQVFDLNGKQVTKIVKQLDCPSNAVIDVEKIDFTASSTPVQFIKVEWFTKNGDLLSDNFYWRGTDYMNYQALESINKAQISASITTVKSKNEVNVKVALKNTSDHVALMIRLMGHYNKSGERVLPLWCNDNYVSLTPGASKIIEVKIPIEAYSKDTIHFQYEGWNVDTAQIN